MMPREGKPPGRTRPALPVMNLVNDPPALKAGTAS
jgi:hypothetical protein